MQQKPSLFKKSRLWLYKLNHPAELPATLCCLRDLSRYCHPLKYKFVRRYPPQEPTAINRLPVHITALKVTQKVLFIMLLLWE